MDTLWERRQPAQHVWETTSSGEASAQGTSGRERVGEPGLAAAGQQHVDLRFVSEVESVRRAREPKEPQGFSAWVAEGMQGHRNEGASKGGQVRAHVPAGSTAAHQHRRRHRGGLDTGRVRGPGQPTARKGVKRLGSCVVS